MRRIATFVVGLFILKKVLAFLFSFLVLAGMGYIFLFSMHHTNEYACVMSHVKDSTIVRQHVGSPVVPGRFVFLSYWRSGGAQVETAFTTTVSGPNGQGRVRAELFHSLAASAMNIELEVDREIIPVYQGEYLCRSAFGR